MVPHAETAEKCIGWWKYIANSNRINQLEVSPGAEQTSGNPGTATWKQVENGPYTVGKTEIEGEACSTGFQQQCGSITTFSSICRSSEDDNGVPEDHSCCLQCPQQQECYGFISWTLFGLCVSDILCFWFSVSPTFPFPTPLHTCPASTFISPNLCILCFSEPAFPSIYLAIPRQPCPVDWPVLDTELLVIIVSGHQTISCTTCRNSDHTVPLCCLMLS